MISFSISPAATPLPCTNTPAPALLFVYLHHFESRDSAVGGYFCVDAVFYVFDGCVPLHLLVGEERDGVFLSTSGIGGFRDFI